MNPATARGPGAAAELCEGCYEKLGRPKLRRLKRVLQMHRRKARSIERRAESVGDVFVKQPGGRSQYRCALQGCRANHTAPAACWWLSAQTGALHTKDYGGTHTHRGCCGCAIS